MTDQNIPPIEEQFKIINELEKTTVLKSGVEAYVISTPWYEKWRKSQELPVGEFAPPIDNSGISDDGKLKDSLNEPQDYRILTKEVWDQLYGWYHGGPEIVVQVLKRGNEVVALTRNKPYVVCYKDKKEKMKLFTQLTVSETENILRKHFCVPDDEKTRLVDYYNESFFAELKGNYLMQESNLQDNQKIALDTLEDGKWRFGKRGGVSVSTPAFQGHGCVGFSNLGNTCFFNSGTQCLMHSMPFVEYLLKDGWDKEINQKNPLGTHGKLVKAFRDLLEQVWRGSSSVLRPSELKHAIGQFAHQFVGYGQQDSHELITYMLDGIHEDLNRITNKPVVEDVTGDGTNDLLTAQKSWERHKKRNDSIVVDTFQGLLKSSLLCPDCHKNTVVFDPYMALSLPITKPHTRSFNLYFVPYDFTQPYVPITISISSKLVSQDIDNAVSDKIGRPVFVIPASVSSSGDLKIGFTGDSYFYQHFVFEVPTISKDYIFAVVKGKKKQYNVDINVTNYFLVEYDDDITSKVNERLQFCFTKYEGSEEAKELASNIKLDNTKYDKPFSAKVETTYLLKTLKKSAEFSNIYANKVTINMDKSKTLDNPEFCIESLTRHALSKSKGEKESSSTTLYDCFEYLTCPEVLDENNQWFCPHCRKFVSASKKTDIWSLPKCLIIHLKRFSTKGYFTQKDGRNVDFPNELDLVKFIRGPQKEYPIKYRLYAVSEHMGSMGGGHYIAHCMVNGKWYCFNDSSVSQASEMDSHGSNAYVLFYERTE